MRLPPQLLLICFSHSLLYPYTGSDTFIRWPGSYAEAEKTVPVAIRIGAVKPIGIFISSATKWTMARKFRRSLRRYFTGMGVTSLFYDFFQQNLLKSTVLLQLSIADALKFRQGDAFQKCHFF